MFKLLSIIKNRIFHQISATILLNPLVKNFFNGKIYQGNLKQVCLPVLNCYSCPAAVTSCPVGSFQFMINYFKNNFSFLILGIIGSIGVATGRWFCGHICPFGFFQDILNKLSKINYHIWKPLRYFKYVALFGITILLTLILKKPAFCSYICPAGTLQAGLTLVWFNDFNLGLLYYWKIFLLMIYTFGSIISKRFFCNTTCPLGLILGAFNKISINQIEVDEDKCIECDKCNEVCPSDIYIYKNAKNIECVRCFECVDVCPTDAISIENNLAIKKGVVKKYEN